MRTRGRVAVAALGYNPIESVRRLPPPADLTPEQAAEWIALVDTMPADHFMRANQGLLEQYCRHMILARRLAVRLEWYEQALERNRGKLNRMADEEGSDAYKDLSRLVLAQDRTLLDMQKSQRDESHAIQVLLRSMRLSQQAVYKPQQLKHPQKGATQNPWEDDDAA